MKTNRFVSALMFSVTMMMVGVLGIVAFAATLLNTAPTYAAPPQVLLSDQMLPIVAFENNQLKLFGLGNSPIVVDTNTNAFMSNHVWSPDGNWLAYIRMGTNGNELMLTDKNGSTPRLIATGLNSGLPIQFSEDGTRLFYALVPNPDEAQSINGNYTVDVMSQTIGSSNSATKLGSFQQASCGGAGPTVYDALYWAETGTGGMRPFLAVTEAGIVHSTTCRGDGIAILNPTTGADRVLDSEITHVSLSPDGKTVLGIKNNQLLVIDLATGQSQPYATEINPDQVIWGAPETDTVYYSIRNVTDETISYTEDQRQKILNATGLDISEVVLNHVAIHRLNLETGIDEIVYENTAYIIGFMTLLPDNQLLMLSEVPSLADWFEAILDVEEGITPELKTNLYLVSLEDAEIRLLGSGLQGARLNDNEYVRLFGPVPQISAQPSTVNVGAQLSITGNNFPIESRVRVYMGASASDLDESPYATGNSNANGDITLSFSLPARFEDGEAIRNGQLVLVAKTVDGLYSAEARITAVVPTASGNNGGNNPKPNNPNPGNPTPVPTVFASIGISPDKGTIGTLITVSGRNFPKNQRVNVHLGGITTGAFNPVYASAFADGNGFVTLSFNMPQTYANGTNIPAGPVAIIAANDNLSNASILTFNYTAPSVPVAVPAITLRPKTVKVKDEVKVIGTNFAPNTTIRLMIGPKADDLRGSYRTVTSDENGNFQTSFKMPEHWKNGGKVKPKPVVVVAVPVPSGTTASATLEIKEKKRNDPPPPSSEPEVTPEPGAPEEPSKEEPSKEEPSEGEKPDNNENPVEEQPVEEQPVEEQPTEEPAPEVEQPVEEQPVEEQPVQEQPTYEEPAPEVQQPVEEQPVEQPVEEQPVQEQPTYEEPAPEVQQPVEEQPVEQPVLVPAISLSASGARRGEGVTLSGSNFPADTTLSIVLIGDTTTAPVYVTTNGGGAFETTYVVPLESGDAQPLSTGGYVLVVSTSGASAQTGFAVLE